MTATESSAMNVHSDLPCVHVGQAIEVLAGNGHWEVRSITKVRRYRKRVVKFQQQSGKWVTMSDWGKQWRLPVFRPAAKMRASWRG